MQWESPASDGGVDIDNYTLTGAGSATLTVPSNGPLTTTLTLSYNEMHMVSITASNCAGESTASVVTIPEGMRLIINTVLRHTASTCVCSFSRYTCLATLHYFVVLLIEAPLIAQELYFPANSIGTGLLD